MNKKITIAIDGPSGSGKSTVAKRLSKLLNILYLDTGAMYRATALKAISLGIDTLNEEKVSEFIDNIDLTIKYSEGVQHTFLDGKDVSDAIREPQVSMAASNISSLKCVRLKMVELQRKIAGQTSCVLDKEKGFNVDLQALQKEIEQRDYNDSRRDFAPLTQAKDAIYIDTSDLSIDEVTDKILSVIRG